MNVTKKALTNLPLPVDKQKPKIAVEGQHVESTQKDNNNLDIRSHARQTLLHTVGKAMFINVRRTQNSQNWSNI